MGLPRDSLITWLFRHLSARFLYGFPYRFQKAWTVLCSMKHPPDAVRVGAWKSLDGISLIAAWLQSSLPSSTQIKPIPVARLESSPPSSKRMKLMSAIWLQSKVQMNETYCCSIAAEPSFEKIKLFSQHGCRAACQVLNKSNLFQVLDIKVVLTLIGPLKMGWSEHVMVPVLFLVLGRKVVLTLIGPLKSGLAWRRNVLFQHRCRAGGQVLHKLDLFLQHSHRAVHQVLNESNFFPATWLQIRLPTNEVYNCTIAAGVLTKSNLFPSTTAEQPAKF